MSADKQREKDGQIMRDREKDGQIMRVRERWSDKERQREKRTKIGTERKKESTCIVTYHKRPYHYKQTWCNGFTLPGKINFEVGE